jgi:hypothetical protein
MDVYRRGDTLCKQIFFLATGFLHHRRQTNQICQQQDGKMPIDHPYCLGWAVIRRHQ